MASMNAPEVPWHAAFPSPKRQEPETMTRGEVLKMMKDDGSVAGKDYLLVDLRRTDHQGGTIRGSINLPAQSLYPALPTVYNMVKTAGIRRVIWYCSSSRGRGTRAACWFSDYLEEKGDTNTQSLILLEGLKGWAKGGAEYVECIDGYDHAYWESQ
ncbi:arsenate reductase Arc2 [Trichoderma guizhouense]|uniref:Arsenate reductase Arc2 n=1 Tax=Trichoderma guizhouense TaxID=1491466 RepID=A0A1T3CU33_9HYPO|nr:arsenate reductase Arc2 [Trichoderma guizhouense]